MTDPLDPDTFLIHDITHFPVVRPRADAVRPGYGPDWVREMERLVSGPTPFVLLYLDPQPEEDHEDFKLRGIWMKVNKARLAARCKAMLRVEPDAGKRDAILKHAAGVEKAFGVPTEVAATVADAMVHAAALCGRPA